MVRDPVMTAAAMAVLDAFENEGKAHTPEEWEALGHLSVAVRDVNEGFHVAVCLDCGPLLPLPFADEEALHAWRDAHALATQHRVITSRPYILGVQRG